jgi:uncharacterized protein (DUF433 family)
MRGNLLARITTNPDIFDGKPIIRGQRLAVEHVLSMLAAGDRPQELLRAYKGTLEADDIMACIVWAHKQGEYPFPATVEWGDDLYITFTA